MAVLRPLAQATEAFFRRFGQETAENEIRWLRAAFDNPRSLLFVPKDAQKPEELDATLAQALKDRVEKHKPLQYIIGTQPFGGIEIKCRAPILIPRPETEWWVSKLAERFQPTLQRRLRILDLGTGTGCISLMLANHYPPGTVWAHGVDNNPQAVQLALENAKELGFSTAQEDATMSRAERIKNNIPSVFTAEVGDWMRQGWLPMGCKWECTSGWFDIVVANPPYISRQEFEELDPSVRDWEDTLALVGGSPHYQTIAGFCQASTSRTKPLPRQPGGVMVMEFNDGDAGLIHKIFSAEKALKGREFWEDQYGKKRTLFGITGKPQYLPISDKFMVHDGKFVPRKGNALIARTKKGKKVEMVDEHDEVRDDPVASHRSKRGIWGIP